MTPEIAAAAVRSLAEDLAHTLAKASALARVAGEERAPTRNQLIGILLDCEPLVFDAQRIISSATRRLRARSGTSAST